MALPPITITLGDSSTSTPGRVRDDVRTQDIENIGRFVTAAGASLVALANETNNAGAGESVAPDPPNLVEALFDAGSVGESRRPIDPAAPEREAALQAREAMQNAATAEMPFLNWRVNSPSQGNSQPSEEPPLFPGWTPDLSGPDSGAPRGQENQRANVSGAGDDRRTLGSTYAGQQGADLVFEIEKLRLPIDDIRTIAGSLGTLRGHLGGR